MVGTHPWPQHLESRSRGMGSSQASLTTWWIWSILSCTRLYCKGKLSKGSPAKPLYPMCISGTCLSNSFVPVCSYFLYHQGKKIHSFEEHFLPPFFHDKVNTEFKFWEFFSLWLSILLKPVAFNPEIHLLKRVRGCWLASGSKEFLALSLDKKWFVRISVGLQCSDTGKCALSVEFKREILFGL